MASYRPIIDIDTHCGPSPDVLKQFADQRLSSRWEELTPYLNVRPDAEGRPQSILRVNPIPYERRLNTKGSALTVAGPGTLGSLDSKDKALGKTVRRGTGTPSTGVEDVSPQARLADMDTEGVDIHLIIPGTWANASTAIDQELAVGMYDAYHRFAAHFCSADLDRLKTVVLAPATDPQWAAKQISNLANERWVSGVIPLLPEDVPVDDPDLSRYGRRWRTPISRSSTTRSSTSLPTSLATATCGGISPWLAPPLIRGGPNVFWPPSSSAACSTAGRR